MNRLNRLFFKADIVCDSPIAIGCGESEYTDNDVLVGSDGLPFIPGTTLAGVCRHYLEDSGKDTDKLFGSAKSGKNAVEESRIIFYEAFSTHFNGIGQRDGVAINLESGTADDGALFNYEVVGEESRFGLRIEINDDQAADGRTYRTYIDEIVSGFNSGMIRIGFKSNRGFGRVHLENCMLDEVCNIYDLICFDWNNMSNAYDAKAVSRSADNRFSYELKLKSFMMIADNSTLDTHDDKLVNAAQLTNQSGRPIIPGTVWCGIFRHYCNNVLTETGDAEKADFMSKVFGSTEQASKIIFDESVLEGGEMMCVTRTAIDRFTGGACDKKLFTNRPVFGGTTELCVTISQTLSEALTKKVKNLLELFVSEIKDGFVNIGSMGSVGGGIFEEIGGADNE